MGSSPALLSLADLCAPGSIDRLRADWGRRSCHLPGGPARIAAWRHPQGVRSWTLHDVHAATREPDGTQDRHTIETDQIDQSLAEGHTVCGNASTDPRLRRVLADLAAHETATDGDPFAKLYISPPGRGYVLHADRYHVLVVQLSGRKQWWYGATPTARDAPAGAFIDRSGTPSGRAVLTHPYQGLPMLDDDGQPVRPPADEALEQVVLTPGDLLYLPPGTWHRTESVSTSVALSLSPPRSLPAERVMALLSRGLLSDPELRTPLPSSDPGAALQACLSTMRSLLEQVDARALARTWAIEHEQHLAAFDPPQPGRPVALSVDAPIERTGGRPLRWLVARDEQEDADAVFFYGAGQEWTLPMAAQPLIEAMAQHERLTIGDAMQWAPQLTEEDIRGVFAALIEAGVLRPRTD